MSEDTVTQKEITSTVPLDSHAAVWSTGSFQQGSDVHRGSGHEPGHEPPASAGGLQTENIYLAG